MPTRWIWPRRGSTCMTDSAPALAADVTFAAAHRGHGPRGLGADEPTTRDQAVEISQHGGPWPDILTVVWS